MSATLVHAYVHTPATSAAFEGGLQALPSGDAFLGWGQQPYMSEYAPNGQQDFDARFTAFTSSYRAYRFPWHAQPQTTPALALTTAADGTMTAYASWNGATDVAGWRVLAGESASRLSAVRSAPKHRFESAIPVHSGEPAFAVQALSSGGRVLATSRTISAPPHLAIYGRSAFVSPSARRGTGQLPLPPPLQHQHERVRRPHAAREQRARTPRREQRRRPLFPPLTRGAPNARARPQPQTRRPAHGARRLRAQDHDTPQADPVHGLRSGPHRSLSASPPLRIVGATDFVSRSGVGGVLAECQSARTCTVRTTVSVGGNVIARTGPEKRSARTNSRTSRSR